MEESDVDTGATIIDRICIRTGLKYHADYHLLQGTVIKDLSD
ncbi:DNA ligase I [Aspergillus luchuensis]|uniref:DNA ligase I n=1 Tax=Aspergillus kawachii TaxID=1069201 RepID=A0A146F4K6_ASPKA|nr:DNA ligase I [Aspergillus luchuensis]